MTEQIDPDNERATGFNGLAEAAFDAAFTIPVGVVGGAAIAGAPGAIIGGAAGFAIGLTAALRNNPHEEASHRE